MPNYGGAGNWMNQGLVGAPENLMGNFNDFALRPEDVGGQGFFGDLGSQDWGGMAKGFGSLAGGVGGLAQAWQGMQGLKLAKNAMKQQQENWDKNYEAQRGDIAYNRGQRNAARARQNIGTSAV